MHLITSGKVQSLTGLTADQLREWTARRGLIHPDSRARGPGSRARYSWQTVLLLRLAVVLNKVFHVELQAQRELFFELAKRLSRTSFPSLRGMILSVKADGDFEFRSAVEFARIENDVLLIRLDPHLDVISSSFGLVEPAPQLSLFPAVVVR